MSNPFQTPTPSLARSQQRFLKSSRKRTFRPAWFGIGAIVITILLLLWFAQASRWNPLSFRNFLLLPGGGDRIFIEQVGMDRTAARAAYRAALASLQDGSYDQALNQFKKLEGTYPGLEDMLWLHEAEAYAGLGNEWAVQKKLQNLLDHHGDSPLRTVALYRIGQSQFRGSEWEKASKTFEQVKNDFPGSTYATGSLYYLGAAITRQDGGDKPRAAEYLRGYLKQCPDCKFSGDAADLLEKLLPHPTSEEQALIGLADASASKDPKKTLAHLTKGNRNLTWLTLGRAQIRAGQRPAGVQSIIGGLGYAKDNDEAKKAIDTIAGYSASPAATLRALSSKHLKTGGDYILWKLAELDPGNANAYLQALLKDYPLSDYAPESNWKQLWPLLAAGQNDAYIEHARAFLGRYGYARSASKALFWIGKLQEKSNPAEATRTYERLLSQYPTSYYAFRASGRLQVLTRNRPDPGWLTHEDRGYPPDDSDPNLLSIMPPAGQFGGNGQNRRDAAVELQAIGAGEDVRLFVQEATGNLPPAVQSWVEQVGGDRAKGLRTIRDALEKQTKDDFLASGNKSVRPQGTKDELRLLYPIYFPEPIRQAGQRNELDPLLIQSLMREESYFNEFAISSSNARGLMQLMPATARDVAGWESLPGFTIASLFTPEVNIRLGSRYLAHLHQLFNGNSMPAVGAYNGGPGAMKRWIQSSPYFTEDPDLFVERIPYEQSRDYIKKVFTSYWNYTRLYGG